MAQTENREKDEKNLQMKMKKGDAKFKLSGGLKEEYHSTNSERCDIAAAHNLERRGQRADVSQGAAIGFFREVLQGAVLALVLELLSVL